MGKDGKVEMGGWLLREQILHKMPNNGIQNRKGQREGLRAEGSINTCGGVKDGRKTTAFLLDTNGF